MKSSPHTTKQNPFTKTLSNELSFEMHSLEWLHENRGNLYNCPHSNSNYEIIWISRGSGIHYADMQKSEFKNNHMFFIRPGQVHQLEPHEALEGFIISFSESFLSIDEHETNATYHTSLFNIFSAISGIAIAEDGLEDIRIITERMQKEFSSSNIFRTDILRRYFKIFLIYVNRELEENSILIKPTRNMEVVQQFMQLLEENFKEQKMVSYYADKLNVTPNYLNEVIKKTTGASAGYHIRQRVVLEAKRQATYSANCMKQIAYFLGFVDMAHFSKFFKNTTGVNFSDFRKGNLLMTSSAA